MHLNQSYAMLIAIGFGVMPISAWADTHRVKIVTDYDNLKMYFEPDSLVIKRGDTVIWVNEIEEVHNVISYPGGIPKGASGFSSPILTQVGETFSFRFDQVGTYQYHCIPHLLMGMSGEIVVERHSSVSDFHEPTNEELASYRELRDPNNPSKS